MRPSVPIPLVVPVALTLLWVPGGQATDLPYTYLEAGYVNVDVDESTRVVDTALDLDGNADTADETGYYLAGSWAFAGRWHVFAEYIDSDQDARLQGTEAGEPVDSDSDFDVIRIRLGAGYVRPMGDRWDLYGRVSYDYIEFDSLRFIEVNGEDSDDHGFGAQLGARLALPYRFDVGAHVRYSSVGDVSLDTDYSADFDDDVLAGVDGRWLVGNRFAVQASYEIGDIDTWTLGARFLFED